MLLSSPNSSSRSAVSLLSLHQFLCNILRYTLTICATVAALSAQASRTCLIAATHYIIFVCLLFLCPAPPPSLAAHLSGAANWRPIVSALAQPDPAPRFPAPHPLICTTSLRTDVAGSAAVYYAATHPQCGSGCAGRGSAPDNEFLVCATGRRSCRCCCRRRRWQCLLSLQIFEFDS